MKILSIVWYKVLPPVFGGQKGIAGFNDHLANHFPLTCICSNNNESRQHLPYRVLPVLPSSKKQFLSPLSWRLIRRTAQQEQVSHIILEHPYHGVAAWLAKRKTGARLIVHSHNIEFNRFRMLGKWWWRLLRSYERWVHRKADLSLFKTEQDRQYAIQHFDLLPDKCMVISYGVSSPVIPPNAAITIRQKHGIAANEKILLFAATLDYEPNAMAVEHIFRHIVPLLQEILSDRFRIIICGRNKFKQFQYLKTWAHARVVYAGEVTDMTSYFAASDVFINPVTTGGGIQTKNIDAIAHGCPVVTFEHMADAAISQVSGEQVYRAASNDWSDFVAQIMQALGKQSPTPASFFRYFDWENILQPLYERLRH